MFTDFEAFTILHTLLSAGGESTTSLLGNAVRMLAEHPELSNLHDLRTRSAGAHDFVQFHVDLPAHLTVGEAHDIIERVEADLCRRFPEMELLIHIDPQGHVDEPDNPLVEENQFSRLEGDG